MKFRVSVVLLALAAALPPCGWALNGDQLVLRSNGFDGGTNWTLQDNGYVGTYINLIAPGEVTISVNAAGTLSGGIDPRMNIVVTDYSAGFDVSAGVGLYEHTFSLPAGKHFVRTEFANDHGQTSRQLTIEQFNVAGATIDNSDTNANALAAADNYIANYRQGNAQVALYGASPGQEVQVKLKNHAFNFGTNLPGSTASQYFDNPNFQQFVRDHFNMVVPSNAGKWSNNEGGRDAAPSMSYVDTILQFAEDNNMRARMHALAWGSQQPNWVATGANGLLNDPTGVDTYNSISNPQGTNLNSLDAFYSDLVAPAGTPNAGEVSELHERINYYIGDGVGSDRATSYTELDVYNESYHTGLNGGASSIWNRYQPAGVSKIYDDAAAAAALAGANVRLYTNEYSVLENQGGDAYANWYRDNIAAIENGDGEPLDHTVSGIGIQYYSHNGHSASLMQKALHNMSVFGVPITLSEFGVQGSVTVTADKIRNMEESHRMIFGTPNATGFLYWGWWAGATDATRESSGVLVDLDWNWTPVGVAWEALRNSWDTELTLNVLPDGTLDFTGFYGQYEVTIGDQTYLLDLTKGTTEYSLIVGPPSADFDFDGDVDGRDFLAWQQGYGLADPSFVDGDANYDGEVDGADLAIWQAAYGGGALTASVSVPEPSSLCLSFLAVLLVLINKNLLQRL